MTTSLSSRRSLGILLSLVVTFPALVIAQGKLDLPTKPLAVAAPPAPSSKFQGVDLATADPGQLANAAAGQASQGKNKEAAQLQYWAVKLGDEGKYNLACWTALAGDIDGAFYWLQEAAIGKGVEASFAGKDSDLASLRKDPRWGKIALFLKACNAYWATNGKPETVLVVPKGYKLGTPIGVLVGMHGLGHNPSGFVDPETYQDFADELNMAIVGVSGTNPTGRHSYVWAEDTNADAARVRKALDEIAARVTIKKGHIITFGFSQGAQMGFEVAFQNPDDYRGSIVMSPGTSKTDLRLAKLKAGPKNKNQGYVCLCGAGEFPGNVAITKADADFARKAGARVEMKLAQGVDRHAFPPDFVDSFVRWVRFIDGQDAGNKPR